MLSVYSEYALEDILRSGIYNVDTDMEDVEKAIAKRGAKRRRARLPVYSQGEEGACMGGGQEAGEGAGLGAGLEAGQKDGPATSESPYRKEETESATGEELEDKVESTEWDSEADDEFEKLYEELEVCGGGGGPSGVTGQFEKIYEDLALGGRGRSPQQSGAGGREGGWTPFMG